jgi:hypothetical protein
VCCVCCVCVCVCVCALMGVGRKCLFVYTCVFLHHARMPDCLVYMYVNVFFL